LPVNDAHLENPLFAASGQIIRHQIPYLARFERVQIQHAVNDSLGFRKTMHITDSGAVAARYETDVESRGPVHLPG